MRTLTDEQIKRQDDVDNAIFELLEQLNPSSKKLDWDIEYIGAVRDEIERIFVDELKLCSEQEFYPYLKCDA